MMKKKAAIELSINFIVVLIISLAIFTFGVAFVYNIFRNASELKQITLEDIDRQIAELNCDSSEKVCLDKDTLNLQRGKFGVITVKVINILTKMPKLNFEIKIDPKMHINPDETTSTTFPVDKIMVKPPKRSMIINSNDGGSVAFGFEVQKDAPSGTYVFDLKVTTPQNQLYDNIHKIYVKVK
jgi:hypothetical protein